MSVTLRDLAKSAGVSPSTVSRVLRNSPQVHPASKNKVLSAVKKLGYRHNPLVDAWAMRFRETHRQSGLHIAHIIGYDSEEISSNAVLQAVTNAVQRRAMQLQISTSTFVLKINGALSSSRLADILYHRGIRAVLFGPFPASVKFDLNGGWNFCMVGIGHSEATRPLHRVVHGRYFSMRRLGFYLQKFQRPGLVGFGPEGSPAASGWIESFCYHSEKIPARYRIPWLPMDRFEHSLFSRWVDRYRPDVVLSPHLEIMRWAEEKNFEFVGLNLSESQPPAGIKGVTHPSEAIARSAMDLLLAQCDWNESGLPPHPRQTAWEGNILGLADQLENSGDSVASIPRGLK